MLHQRFSHLNSPACEMTELWSLNYFSKNFASSPFTRALVHVYLYLYPCICTDTDTEPTNPIHFQIYHTFLLSIASSIVLIEIKSLLLCYYYY